MRISDWSSDVCSSDLKYASAAQSAAAACPGAIQRIKHPVAEIGLRMKPEAVIEAGILDPGGGPMSAVREQGRAEHHHVGHIGEHGAAKQALARDARLGPEPEMLDGRLRHWRGSDERRGGK